MRNRKVTLQKRGSTVSDDGQRSDTWDDIYSTGAQIRTQSGVETLNQRREVSTKFMIIKIPYSSKGLELDTTNAVLVGTVRYDIDSIDIDSTWRKYISLSCSGRNEV